MLLSILNLSLVIGDLPSFLVCFVVFSVLVRRRELMVLGLSIGVAVYCERRLFPLVSLIVVWVRCGRRGTWRQKWERLKAGERNGKLPLRTCPRCSVPEPHRSP